MAKIEVHMVFDSMEEAIKHFVGLANPTSQTSGVAPTGIAAPVVVSPITAPPTSALVLPVSANVPMAGSATSAPTASPEGGAPVDHTLAVRTAMSEMIARLDQSALGSGAAKAKGLLNAAGFQKAKDVTAEAAQRLIAAFQAAT